MSLLDFELTSQTKLAIQIALTIWMAAVAWIDFRTARIPNALVAPVMLAAGAFRLLEGLTGEARRLGLLIAWVVIFAFWMLNFYGGGDAKFLMAEFALFPHMEFTAVLAFILLVLTLPLLVLEMRRTTLRDAQKGLRDRLITGEILPTRQDLMERGRSYAWTFAVPGLIYTWWYW